MTNVPAAAAAAGPLFDSNHFMNRIKPLVRKQRGVTYGRRDNINDYIYKKQHDLDPTFQIPTTHTSRFHAIPLDSDSAISEYDSDEDELRFSEKVNWMNAITPNLERIFSLLMNNDEQKTFARGLAAIFGFTVKQMTLLGVMD